MDIRISSAPPPAYQWADMDDAVAFRKLQAVARMREKKFKKAHGSDGRGLIPILFRPDGTPRFHKHIEVFYRDGVCRAVRCGSIYIDLDNPGMTTEGRRIYQAPSLNAVLSMREISEELGARAFKVPNARWYEIAAQLGVEHDDAEALIENRGLAGRCNAACMAEVYRGVTPAEAPLYAALRALPISLRHRSGWLVDPTIDYEFRIRGAQLLDNFPPLALVWDRAQQAATASGAKLKEIAATLGFDPATTKTPPAALSVINYRLDLDKRDIPATAHELAFLTAPLCNALPIGSFRGKITIDQALLAYERGATPDEAAAIGVWAAPHIAKLAKESDFPESMRVTLADYIAATPETLALAGGVDPWRDTMTLKGACDAARIFTIALADAVAAANAEAADKQVWSCPSWAIGDPPPPDKGRAWFPVYLNSRANLRWAGSVFRNCAISYARACAMGDCAIYIVMRRPSKGDKPSDIIDVPAGVLELLPTRVVRGAMVEIRPAPGGKVRRVQCCGIANAPTHTLRNSITQSVSTWLDARNDPRAAE
jgi:hypothetical protein